MSSIISIGLSGMLAAQARVSAAAANIVHAGTVGRIPATGVPAKDAVYQPVDVVQFDTSSFGRPGGVGYSYTARTNGYSIEHDPSSPLADGSGNVATPNVDITTELVSMVAAKYQFYASAKVVQVGEQMMRAAISLIA
jgi:flagellar basal-body rod protein FlgC